MVSSDRDESKENDQLSKLERKFKQRISRLEEIVAKQEIELHRLRKTCHELSETAEAFATVVKLLKESGIKDKSGAKKGDQNVTPEKKKLLSPITGTFVESYDESVIFGSAPSSVIDAADAAGSAILAGMLAGKKRMLVDVRDAELSTDLETLVQFIELAILPVAAGLEGLESQRNRVKIVFPKVSQLLEYRKTMALAAPEVVALSTLGFDPVEDSDQLVVIVAPAPDDDEGIKAMQELLAQKEKDGKETIQQTVVILNYHMFPVPSLPVKFLTAYHLRLLRVQFMSRGLADELQQNRQNGPEQKEDLEEVSNDKSPDDVEASKKEDEELEAAMQHAHEVGMNQGITRAMVIRAYPRPWHLFVDTSPGTDADFEVAGTFVEEPTMEEINFSIVECLEGSEREDEIVAKQMQEALDEGQLDAVEGMIDDLEKVEEDDNDEMETD
ncbi:unnamed protein product [Cylindrotheca closterium]|uniref:DUF1995 domain-containing protein n=1 Tax=Cylindrotheca closterium TaxID=2856 RepID=A0AAD2GAK1_9STRA|nr:unnamed protein product [Cylindrotheca closterium]